MNNIQRQYLAEKLSDEQMLQGSENTCPGCKAGYHEEPCLPAVCECPCHGHLLPAQEFQRAA